MARRNIANRKDIEPDALRQRRDLYAVAIGLVIFHLAGGEIAKGTSFGSLLPLTLKRPAILEVAAWGGFFYFWFRFWLISKAEPWNDFLEDVKWQAGNLPAIRELAAKLITDPTQYGPIGETRRLLLEKNGAVPWIGRHARKPNISLQGIWPTGDNGSGRIGGISPAGPFNSIAPEDRLTFWLAWAKGFPLAMARERAFTDYTLPHVFALVTLVVGIGAHLVR